MSKNIGCCNKRGRFEVNADFFNGLNVGDGVNLFNGMVILHANRDWLQGYVEYFAIHEDFAPMSEGEIIPTYQGIFGPGSIYPKWEKVQA